MKYTTWWFNICVCCKRIAPQVNISITSHIYHICYLLFIYLICTKYYIFIIIVVISSSSSICEDIEVLLLAKFNYIVVLSTMITLDPQKLFILKVSLYPFQPPAISSTLLASPPPAPFFFFRFHIKAVPWTMFFFCLAYLT